MNMVSRSKGWGSAAFLFALAGCGVSGSLSEVSAPDAGQADTGPAPATADAGAPGASVDAGADASVADAGTDVTVADATPLPLPFPPTYSARSVAAFTDAGTGVELFTFDQDAGFAPEGTLTLSAPACRALAFDAQRSLYVACSASEASPAQPSEVLVFASGSWKDTPPVRALSAPLIAASDLTGVAVDPAGNVYVGAASVAGDDAGFNDGAIVVFGPSSDSTPTRVIQSLGMPLELGNGIALDSSDNVWVICPNAAPLWEFAAGSDGRVAPIRVLSSPTLALPDFAAIAMGTAGRIWLTSSNRIAWYSTSPSVTFGGETNDVGPLAIAADAIGNVFVLTSEGEIQAFSGSALADPKVNNPVPEATLSLPALDVNSGVAVAP